MSGVNGPLVILDNVKVSCFNLSIPQHAHANVSSCLLFSSDLQIYNYTHGSRLLVLLHLSVHVPAAYGNFVIIASTVFPRYLT